MCYEFKTQPAIRAVDRVVAMTGTKKPESLIKEFLGGFGVWLLTEIVAIVLIMLAFHFGIM
jgi:hypothetical protein